MPLFPQEARWLVEATNLRMADAVLYVAIGTSRRQPAGWLVVARGDHAGSLYCGFLPSDG